MPFHYLTDPGSPDRARVVLRLGGGSLTDIGSLADSIPTLDDLMTGRRPRRNLARVTIMLDGQAVGELPMIVDSGQVTCDDGRDPRRMFSADVPPMAQWLPGDPTHVLHPTRGATLVVEAGVGDPHTGREWWWPMGHYAVTEPEQSVKPDGVDFSISCPDISWRLSRLSTAAPLRIKKGTPVETAIGMGIAALDPRQQVNLAATGETTPALSWGGVGEGNDRSIWSSCRELAKSCGYDLRVDVNGVVAMVPLVPATTGPKRTWRTGDGGLVLDASHGMSATEQLDALRMAYQWGEAWWPAKIAVGRIADYDGDTTMILSDRQAKRALEAQWRRRGGLLDTVSGTVVCDPRVDAGWLVELDVADIGAVTTRRLVSVSWPLPGPTMSVKLADLGSGG